jgi:hypothetical protein
LKLEYQKLGKNNIKIVPKTNEGPPFDIIDEDGNHLALIENKPKFTEAIQKLRSRIKMRERIVPDSYYSRGRTYNPDNLSRKPDHVKDELKREIFRVTGENSIKITPVFGHLYYLSAFRASQGWIAPIPIQNWKNSLKS